MGLALIQPLAATFLAGGTGGDNLGTASPREVWALDAVERHGISIDLGEPRTVDTLFLGSWTGLSDDISILYRASGPHGLDGAVVATGNLRLPGTVGASGHGLLRFPPTTSRWWQLELQPFGYGALPLTVGRLALGLAFEHATALGGGRLLVDPAPRQAFADGGFGIGEGTVKRIVRWRFEDLTDDDVERLERLGEDRGTSRPLVAVEHRPGGPRALDVHYGLFGTFEANERADPRETKWAFSLEEWR